MGKKWWYRYGLQTQLLLGILCLTPYAFAAQHVAGTVKKGKPGSLVKSSKIHSVQTPVSHSPKKAEGTSKQIRAKTAKTASPPTAKTASVSSASARKATSSIKAEHSARTAKEKRVAKLEKRSQSARTATTNRRVIILKETKNHKYVKIVVTIPSPRAAKRSVSRLSSSSQKSRQLITSRTHRSLAEQSLLHVPSTPPEKSEWSQPWPEYSPERAHFVVNFNDERLPYRLNSAFVLPGDEIFLEISDTHLNSDYTLRAALGKERQLGVNRWYWHAPLHPGVYPVKIQQTRSGEAVTLNVFVMVPLNQVEDGALNGYRIGHYPTVALRQQPIYTPPRGFIEVTPDNENILVSPHFRLQQFLCKQESGYPKYLILDARLLVALELLLEKANAHGYKAHTFTVMSGYRTPYYNRAIGNSTTYSRHLWGDAADIFIDENPPDGQMDDLNQDGEIDTRDAGVLYDLIENEYESRFQRLLVGGLAQYHETSSHGPFVHVDVRGVEARWGERHPNKNFSSSPIPVTLRSSGNPSLRQPSYWDSETDADSAP